MLKNLSYSIEFKEEIQQIQLKVILYKEDVYTVIV